MQVFVKLRQDVHVFRAQPGVSQLFNTLLFIEQPQEQEEQGQEGQGEESFICER